MTQYLFTAYVTRDELNFLVETISPHANEGIWQPYTLSSRVVQDLRAVLEMHRQPETKLKIMFGESAFHSIRIVIHEILEQKTTCENSRIASQKLAQILERAWQRTRPTMFPRSAHLYSHTSLDSEDEFANAPEHFIT
jgi:hypothetical protein